jgi:hypothetical protein
MMLIVSLRWPVVALLLAATLAVWSSLTRIHYCRLVLLALSWVITCVVLFYVGLLLWILRDGLGPDSLPTSYGVAAIWRFLSSSWTLSSIFIIPVLCTVFHRVSPKKAKI